ncbi:WcaF family extracellular polysaccharide biosynthesis acetyltransferase [Vannielia litorea]|uniref:WcaF family extracellular polysaccharide biosynthesis acetyltransferase n=1 Tax=Vannielia litorea TaxID=1217970 RepID=UPI001BCC6A62|nr:WcaF family extracellular polysaccharide biosynthesis acetyltransferase [Vannielia litorea]MBS8228121.1 colanic acid biosynthesis acetyltransferase WcaF [Vannielia litorea]
MEQKCQSLSEFQVPPGFRGRSALVVQLWWIVQATLIRLSPQPLYGWRAFWWRAFGARVGKGVKIRPSARVTYPWKVTIGDHCWIGDRAELYSLETIKIGSDVCISQDAYICTGSHDMTRRDFAYDCHPVLFEDQCWIAAGAFVGPGVTVGEGAVLAARSVAMRSLDAHQVHVGQPARAIGARGCTWPNQ